MTQFTYDTLVFGDTYKDVYGFRPRQHEFYTAAPERKQMIWDQLHDQLAEIMNDYDKAEEHRIAYFDGIIEKYMTVGAATAEAAVRWMLQAEGDDDVGYLEVIYDLPYGYLAQYKET
jgi:hypothetical protein